MRGPLLCLFEVPFLLRPAYDFFTVRISQKRTAHTPCPHIRKTNQRLAFISLPLHHPQRYTTCPERIGELFRFLLVNTVNKHPRLILDVIGVSDIFCFQQTFSDRCKFICSDDRHHNKKVRGIVLP